MKSIRVAIVVALALAAMAAVIRLVSPPSPPAAHEVLRNVYSPRFGPVPPRPSPGELLSNAWIDLRSPAGVSFLRRWLPSQSGTLWLALLVALVVGFDFERPRNPRNLDLLAMQALGFLFFDILVFTRRVDQPQWLGLLWRIFSAIVAVSLFVAVRAVWRVFHPISPEWRAAARGRAIVAVALIVLALDVAAAAVREPDDSGYFVNLGAQRLRERGLLPYGDPLLTGTPGAAYGPLLYVAHLPFQLAVDPAPVNRISSPLPPLGDQSTYYLPSPLATKLCTIAFLLLTVVSLLSVGRRLGHREIGWGLVALYCGSAFVMGVGGEEYFIGGMTFVSHIGPPAVTTAAFAALGRPAAAGALLVAAAGCGFYPAFLFPAWAGYYWNRRRELARFVIGVAVSAIVLGAFVLLRSRPAGGRGLVGTILWDTFGHHSDPAGYGASPFGFWGQREGVQGWMMRPLAGGSGLAAPIMLLFFGVALSCFFLARRRSAQALALLSAAIVIAANLVKIHSTGTYVAWFYPFLLLGWFLPRPATMSDSSCPTKPDLRPS